MSAACICQASSPTIAAATLWPLALAAVACHAVRLARAAGVAFQWGRNRCCWCRWRSCCSALASTTSNYPRCAASISPAASRWCRSWWRCGPGLSIYGAAFIAEIVRAAILSVHKGQREAALSLGLRPRQVLSKIILPQALRVMVPPITSQYLNIIKSSSLGAAVAYPELYQIFAGTAMMQSNREIEIDRPPDGSVPLHQSHRLGIHELVQSPRRAGGTMSDVVAGHRQPIQGGLLPRHTGGRLPNAIDWARREPVQLGLQQHSDGHRPGAGVARSAAAVPLGGDACDDLGDDTRGVHR